MYNYCSCPSLSGCETSVPHVIHSKQCSVNDTYACLLSNLQASRVSAEVLSSENVQLRCTLGLYEGLVDTGGGGLGEGGGTDGLHTAASSALMELTELRR